MSETNELPLYMMDGGKEEIDYRKRELETYLKILKQKPRHMMERTFIALNTHSIEDAEVGRETAEEIKAWWKDNNSLRHFCIWMETNEHKCNGKYGNWSCGFLGSRWADCDINGRRCRLAFYTRKYNPDTIQNIEDTIGKKYDYAIFIDPTN